MANTFFNNYGNCTNFQLCNENDEFYQNNNDGGCGDKDYRNLLMLNTPPSKANQQSKYLMGGVNLNHNAEASLFSCTPKDEQIKTSKDDIKPSTMFNSNMKMTGMSQAKCNMLMQTPPNHNNNLFSKSNMFHLASPAPLYQFSFDQNKY